MSAFGTTTTTTTTTTTDPAKDTSYLQMGYKGWNQPLSEI